MKRFSLISGIILSSSFVGFADPLPEPPPKITPLTSTSFNIDWDGTLGNTYFIQYSADLISWDYMPVIKSGVGVPLGYGFDATGGKLFLRLHYTDIATSNALTADFDGDGISNWDEVKEGGTHTSPLMADTNGDGIRDDGLVFEAQNDPDGAALPSSLAVGLTGRWDFEQLNGNSYPNKVNTSYPAIVGGLVPIDNEGIVSKASKYSNNGDWLKIDPRVFVPNSSNSISLWFSFEKDWVQNKPTIYIAAKRTTFWSYNSSYTAYPKLVLSVFKATDANDTQKIILSTYTGGLISDKLIANVPQGKFVDDSSWHHLTFVQDATTKASIWLDGEKLVEQYTSNNFVASSSDGWFTIGKTFPIAAAPSNDTNFRGEIDRLRTYNKPLSRNEISALYQQNVDGDMLYDWFEATYRKDKAVYYDEPGLDDDKDELTNEEEQTLTLDPRNFDTDGDLLPDGFEHIYQLDPKSSASPNGTLDDPDGDGLLNIDEVIYGGDPKKTDTDGDGTNDYVESTQGGFVNDASDNGNAPAPEEIMQLKLSVGDPSGSHSERYSLKIKDLETSNVIVEHQARDFGVVSSKVYNQFRKGKSYSIQIRWLDTNKPDDELPDFDYFSEVAFVNAEDDNGYIRIDAMDYSTKMKATPENGQKVLENSRDAQGEPVGTGDSGSQDFLDTIAGYRALLLNTDVAVLNNVEQEPPVDGTVVEKTDEILYQLSLSISDLPVLLKDCITWERRQLKWDGTYEEWSTVQDATGHAYKENPSDAGIFEIKAVVDGQDYLFKRKEDDPHSKKKKGDNDCYGVADAAWQVSVREAARDELGSLLYAYNAKKFPLPKKKPKCNLFVAEMADAGGAPVPRINISAVLGVTWKSYPPVANQWVGAITDKPIPKWPLLAQETYPQPGWVISRAGAKHGHTGIIDYDGAWLSAGADNVNRNADLRDNGYQPARFRKYTP